MAVLGTPMHTKITKRSGQLNSRGTALIPNLAGGWVDTHASLNTLEEKIISPACQESIDISLAVQPVT